MRIAWFDGRAWPVSSHPRGIEDPGTHWHVQTPNGDWHAVLPRSAGKNGDTIAWRAVTAAVTE